MELFAVLDFDLNYVVCYLEGVLSDDEMNAKGNPTPEQKELALQWIDQRNRKEEELINLS